MAFVLGEPTVQQYFDSNGDPLVNGTIEFYVTNTTTPTSVYSDSLGTAIGTSVTLGSIGQPINSGVNVALFFDESVNYKIIRKDENGTEIGPTIDPYKIVGPGTAFTTDGGVSTDIETYIQRQFVLTDYSGVTADGDGAGGGTDSYAGIQNAINAVEAAGGGKLIVPPGIYRCDTALTLDASHVTIEGEGYAAFDFTNISTVGGDGQGSNIVLCFNVKGTGRSTSSALTSDANVTDFTVDVTDGSVFSPDDWVQVSSTDHYPFAATDVDRAEVHRVRSVATNTVSLVDPIVDEEQGYLTADTATLHKVSYIENIHFHNMTFIGKNEKGLIQEGLRFNWVKNFSITNCRFEGFDFFSLNISNSIIGEVHNNYFRGTFWNAVAPGNSFYGIVLYHSTQWVNVTDNKGERIRHLVVTSGTSNEQGEPLFCTIRGNIIWDPMGGDAGRSFGYENHGFGRHIEWSSNQCHGGYALINIERSDNTVIGNIGRGLAQSAIIVGVTGTSGIRSGGLVKNLLIANNKITYLTDQLDGTADRCGVEFMATTNSRYENIKVVDNEFFNYTSTTTPHYGMRIRAALTTSKGVVVRGNTFYLSTLGGTAATDVAVLVDANMPTVVQNNDIYNYPRAITLSGDNQHAIGNMINSVSVPVSANSIYALGDNNVIRGNVIQNADVGVRTDAAATDSVVTDNTFINCNTTVSDGGTGTVTTAGNVTK